jgi:hypothetical protein
MRRGSEGKATSPEEPQAFGRGHGSIPTLSPVSLMMMPRPLLSLGFY